MTDFKNTLEKLDEMIQKLEVSTSEKNDDSNPPTNEEVEKTQNKSENQNKQKPQKEKKIKKPAQKVEKDPMQDLYELYESADLRVGEIIDCQPLEGSDKLYIEKIKFSDNEVRTILSGLQKYVPIEQMTGKCVVFYNLKPRPLAGQMSNGMVMCSQNKEHTQVDLLRPHPDIPIGTRIHLSQKPLDSKEVPIINPKKLKKFLELLNTDSEGLARFSDFCLSTGDQKLTKTNQPNGVIG